MNGIEDHEIGFNWRVQLGEKRRIVKAFVIEEL